MNTVQVCVLLYKYTAMCVQCGVYRLLHKYAVYSTVREFVREMWKSVRGKKCHVLYDSRV